MQRTVTQVYRYPFYIFVKITKPYLSSYQERHIAHQKWITHEIFPRPDDNKVSIITNWRELIASRSGPLIFVHKNQLKYECHTFFIKYLNTTSIFDGFESTRQKVIWTENLLSTSLSSQNSWSSLHHSWVLITGRFSTLVSEACTFQKSSFGDREERAKRGNFCLDWI
jgi:hypothetical protein